MLYSLMKQQILLTKNSYQYQSVGLVMAMKSMNVPRTTTDTLTAAIKDVLIHCALPLTQCRGQGY